MFLFTLQSVMADGSSAGADVPQPRATYCINNPVGEGKSSTDRGAVGHCWDRACSRAREPDARGMGQWRVCTRFVPKRATRPAIHSNFKGNYNAWFVGRIIELNRRCTKSENVTAEFEGGPGNFIATTEEYGAHKSWVLLAEQVVLEGGPE